MPPSPDLIPREPVTDLEVLRQNSCGVQVNSPGLKLGPASARGGIGSLATAGIIQVGLGPKPSLPDAEKVLARQAMARITAGLHTCLPAIAAANNKLMSVSIPVNVRATGGGGLPTVTLPKTIPDAASTCITAAVTRVIFGDTAPARLVFPVRVDPAQ